MFLQLTRSTYNRDQDYLPFGMSFFLYRSLFFAISYISPWLDLRFSNSTTSLKSQKILGRRQAAGVKFLISLLYALFSAHFFNFCPFFVCSHVFEDFLTVSWRKQKSYSFSKERCEKWSLADKLRICWLLLHPAEIIEALWDSAFMTLINLKSSMH